MPFFLIKKVERNARKDIVVLFKLRAAAFFFWFGGILGSASGAEFPVSLSNHVDFTPRLLYSSAHHSPESFTHQKTG